MIKKLEYYETDNTDPCRNLAVEEYLTLHTQMEECILYLWQNRRTVVIGRNQNCWKECRIAKLSEDGGSLVRRLSGGGAVFHDLGNLNFTFCVRKPNYDVNRQLQVIACAVRQFGVQAQKTGRNDVTVEGRKISGNAFYESEDYCYHHGTLLIDVNKEDMSKYLNVSKEKLQSRGVDSVRSRVANLKDFAPGITVEAMREALKTAFGVVYGLPVLPFPQGRLDAAAVEASRKRFASWDWIYGKKIPFQHSFGKRFSWGDIELEFDVNGGVIRQVNAFSDGMCQDFIAELPDEWKGCRYEAQSLIAALGRIPASGETEQQMRRDLAMLVMEHL